MGGQPLPMVVYKSGTTEVQDLKVSGTHMHDAQLHWTFFWVLTSVSFTKALNDLYHSDLAFSEFSQSVDSPDESSRQET